MKIMEDLTAVDKANEGSRSKTTMVFSMDLAVVAYKFRIC
jgi:hypothetical protein